MRKRALDRWSPPRFSRRRALGLGAGAVVSTIVTPTPSSASGAPAAARSVLDQRRVVERSTVTDQLLPEIRPRSDWAGDLAPTGELVPENDVRFLLVHHTASTNDYAPDGIAEQIRGWYQFHTGPEKGWPDIAYNFFVDRYGGMWEARAGSLAGPVRGDATGGSQGFALLCCSIGDHTLEPMTPEATQSMVRLLAWLGETYGVDTTPGTTVSFTSRGSSRWPAGTEVTARTISGHRDMSTTSCPGDFLYDELQESIPAAVTQIRLDTGGGTTSSETTEPSTSTTPPSTDAAATAPPSSAPTTGVASDQTGQGGATGQEEALGAAEADDGRSPALIGTGIAAATIAAGGALVSRIWRRSDTA